MRREDYIKNNQALLDELPNFINEYYIAKSTVPFSSATLYQYLNEFKRFFTWCIDTEISEAKSIAEIHLSELEHFKKTDMELYKAYLLNREKQSANHGDGVLSHSTVNRSLNALSGLFRYLTEETEDDEGEPYFYRNVMKKISLVRDSETFATRARNIKDKLMLGNKDAEYLNFIQNDYINSLHNVSNRTISIAKRDRERDVAINALMLGTGIRVSELTNADLRDLDIRNKSITVMRKGGKRDVVPIAKWVLPYITPYLEIRGERYLATDLKTAPALFLTKRRGTPNRIAVNTVENLVAKYSDAFGTRVTPHKLRHTLATKLYDSSNGNAQLVATQLGQSSLTATPLYVHMVDDEQREALDKISKQEHQ